jgi:nucleotide-binding universal stress UspA family protein
MGFRILYPVHVTRKCSKISKGGWIMEIKNILFPSDFSEESSHALQYAVDMAKRYGARLYFIHVVHTIYDTSWYIPTSIDEIYNDLEKSAQKELERYVEDLRGLNTERKVLTGIPYEVIVKFAKDNKIDLIIIGSHGRKGIDRILFGSTAAQVVRYAPCPVLTVRLPMYQR